MLGIEQFTTKQDLTGKIIKSDTRYVYNRKSSLNLVNVSAVWNLNNAAL